MPKDVNLTGSIMKPGVGARTSHATKGAILCEMDMCIYAVGSVCCDNLCLRKLSADFVLQVRTNLYHKTTPQNRFDIIQKHVSDAVRSKDGYATVTWEFNIDGYDVCERAFVTILHAAPSTVRGHKKTLKTSLQEHGWKGVPPAQRRAEVKHFKLRV
jgi:hypothetical protein